MKRKNKLLNNLSARLCSPLTLSALFVLLLFSGGWAVAQSCVTTPAGLISWWPGDGDAADIHGLNSGSHNGVSFVPGVVDQAFSFDGVDDYVEVADAANLQLAADLTIDFWVKPAATQILYANIFRKEAGVNSGFGIEMNNIANSNQYYAWWKSPNLPVATFQCTSPTTELFSLTPNVWQHVAFVKDGDTRLIYIDGVNIPGATCVGTDAAIQTNNAPIRIGKWAGPFRAWEGELDEIDLFNRALTANEIEDIYILDTAGKCKVGDGDDDGVLDNVDNCPTVLNADQADLNDNGIGDVCEIAQLCPTDGDWKNHGKYVSCVTHAAKDLWKAGAISRSEKSAIVSAAAQSDVGK